MLSGWPGGIVGELGLLNNRMFLRILVLERSLHFASLAIGDVVSESALAALPCVQSSEATRYSVFAPFCNGLGELILA
jgi:hypothetical protein